MFQCRFYTAHSHSLLPALLPLPTTFPVLFNTDLTVIDHLSIWRHTKIWKCPGETQESVWGKHAPKEHCRGLVSLVYFFSKGCFLGSSPVTWDKINQFLAKNNKKNLVLWSTRWLNPFRCLLLSRRHEPSLKVSTNTDVKAFSAQTWPRCLITNLRLQNAAGAHVRTNLVILSLFILWKPLQCNSFGAQTTGPGITALQPQRGWEKSPKPLTQPLPLYSLLPLQASLFFFVFTLCCSSSCSNFLPQYKSCPVA